MFYTVMFPASFEILLSASNINFWCQNRQYKKYLAFHLGCITFHLGYIGNIGNHLGHINYIGISHMYQHRTIFQILVSCIFLCYGKICTSPFHIIYSVIQKQTKISVLPNISKLFKKNQKQLPYLKTCCLHSIGVLSGLLL